MTVTRFFAFLLFLCASNVVAQIQPDEVSLIEKLIRDKKNDGSIVYTNHISITDAYRISTKLKAERLNDKNNPSNILFISTKERKEIQKELALLSKPFWNSDLFKESKMIEEQSVDNYFRTVFNEYSETLSNPNNSQIDKSNLLKETPQPYVFEFTPPLYLRDKSLCLIFMKTICGSECGSEELTFYKKENEKWEKFMVLAFE